MKRYKIAFLILFVQTIGLTAVSAQPKAERWAFGDGEHLEFTVSYNWGFVWIDAGMVDFKARKQIQDEGFNWYFISTGQSFRKFDWLFKVRDTFEVKTTDALVPIRFRRHTYEGGYIIYNDYEFNQKKKEVYTFTFETKKTPYHDTLRIYNNATDVLTATYITRSLHFDHYQVGNTILIPMILDDIVFELPIVYLGKEIFTTRKNERFNSLKFSVRLEEGTMFRAGEELFVWVTDDANKLPLMIEAKITVGSIKVHLNHFENIAHPLQSKLE